MSLRQQLRFFPFVIGMIALVLGVQISVSMGQRPGHSERKPSSVVPRITQSLTQFDIGCSQKDVSFQTVSDQIRIMGCLGELGAPVKIVNQSTAVELSVLENEEMFTTDYFKLKPSKNLLKVSYKDDTELLIPVTFKAPTISK